MAKTLFGSLRVSNNLIRLFLLLSVAMIYGSVRLQAETATNTIEFDINYFDQKEDGVGGNPNIPEAEKVIEPIVIYTRNINEKNKVKLKYQHDRISSASISSASSSVTSASVQELKPLEDPDETYHSVTGSWTYTPVKETAITNTLGYSTEPDFKGLQFGVAWSQDLFKGNLTTIASANVNYDQMDVSQRGLQDTDDRTSTNIEVSANITLDPSTVFFSGLAFTGQQGFLHGQYNVIMVLDHFTGNVADYPYEMLPDTRNHYIFNMGIERFIDVANGSVFSLMYRYHDDDWAIQSSTITLEYRLRVVDFLRLTPMARYYIQDGTKYFEAYITDAEPLPQYYTQDSDLGAFNALSFGLKVRFTPTWVVSSLKTDYEFIYEHYIRSDGIIINTFSLNSKFQF